MRYLLLLSLLPPSRAFLPPPAPRAGRCALRVQPSDPLAPEPADPSDPPFDPPFDPSDPSLSSLLIEVPITAADELPAPLTQMERLAKSTGFDNPLSKLLLLLTALSLLSNLALGTGWLGDALGGGGVAGARDVPLDLSQYTIF
ncbi:hypothetical protein TeGR_g9600 [Tetraparma gracilis]|uniref:Uncharacterized protein n=1 Tax=Tetraparma gracilis TaxID=2962635 RepID=A0ABQ6N418_9STRA|nr:hypothetical protein TeGR_g9600 [Tetraparma gracilis]